MRLLIKENPQDASVWIADYIVKKINTHVGQKGSAVLGLPTGSSPLGVYKELIRRNKAGEVSFQQVITFNMDEYIGLPASHPQSYHSFMWNNLFSHIDINPANVHILNGMAENPEDECLNFEKQIVEAGGIDLFFGGVGSDGHIAFNEPGSSLHSRTRIKSLTRDTLIANSRFFDNNPDLVPRKALTVGVATITDAREVLILACGHNKARAVRHAVEEAISHLWTISVLQLHPNGIIVCDEEAALELKVGTYKYFKEIESIN